MNARQLRAVKSNVKWKVKAKPYGGKRQALNQDELDRLFAPSRTTATATGTTWSRW